MSQEFDASKLSAQQTADRKSRDGLRQAWSDIADAEKLAADAQIPTLMDEVDRQVESVKHEIGRLREALRRMTAAGIDTDGVSSMIVMLESFETKLIEFRRALPDEITAKAAGRK